MPYYNLLKDLDQETRRRTIKGIERLRRQKAKETPTRKLKDTLLLATWNVRDFGNEDKRAQGKENRPGPRLAESFFYLAEVISAFDIVALQEVNSLDALKRLMEILGPSWDYLATDIKPSQGGNFERMVFVYDTRKVWFKHLTGQVVVGGNEQFVRTPFYAAFQAGWFQFSLCTVHILYGDFQDTTERKEEIEKIAKFLSKRVKRTGENMILLGDFNILNRKDTTFKPLEENGWVVPAEHATSISQKQFYDQIAFKISKGELRQGPSEPNAGAFKFFNSVFRPGEWEKYYQIAAATGRPMDTWDNTRNWPKNDRFLTRKEYFKQWRTWQMSDHYPLWVELEIDFSDEYLKYLSKLS